MMVRNAGEEVMALRWEVSVIVPLLLLQLDVSLLLVRAHFLQQHADAMGVRMLRAQSDEKELHAEVRQVSELHGIRIIEPLEARRIVEREIRLRKALPD